MATDRWLKCDECNFVPPWAPLLQQLTHVADRQHCICGAPLRLHLRFAFALGAGRGWSRVEAAFRPRSSPGLTWQHQGSTIEFIPFLVIVVDAEEGRAVWMPYWHLDSGARRPIKYGQFAPYMDMDVFFDLLSQARAHGYLP